MQNGPKRPLTFHHCNPKGRTPTDSNKSTVEYGIRKEKRIPEGPSRSIVTRVPPVRRPYSLTMHILSAVESLAAKGKYTHVGNIIGEIMALDLGYINRRNIRQRIYRMKDINLLDSDSKDMWGDPKKNYSVTEKGKKYFRSKQVSIQDAPIRAPLLFSRAKMSIAFINTPPQFTEQPTFQDTMRRFKW